MLSSPTTTANLKLAALGSSSSSSLRMRRNSPGGMPAPSLSKTFHLPHTDGGGEVYPARGEDVGSDGDVPGPALTFHAPALEEGDGDELTQIGLVFQNLGAAERHPEVVEDPPRRAELGANLHGDVSRDARRRRLVLA